MNWVMVLLGIAVVCILWIAANFVFKLTLKMFTIGCLGILLLGLLCAVAVYFGGS
jgi:hypothetical protein